MTTEICKVIQKALAPSKCWSTSTQQSEEHSQMFIWHLIQAHCFHGYRQTNNEILSNKHKETWTPDHRDHLYKNTNDKHSINRHTYFYKYIYILHKRMPAGRCRKKQLPRWWERAWEPIWQEESVTGWENWKQVCEWVWQISGSGVSAWHVDVRRKDNLTTSGGPMVNGLGL